MMQKFELLNRDGFKLGIGTLSGEKTSQLTFENIRKGTKIMIEAAESGKSLIIDRSEDEWKLSTGTTSEFNGSNAIELGTLGKIIKSLHDTGKAHQIGELPKYLIMTALVNGASVKIGSHDGMKAMILKAGAIPMLLRKGSYLLAQQGVRTDMETISGEDSKLISDLLGFRFFQKIYGSGIYAIEAKGDCDETYLLPGETKLINPKTLVAMSETIKIVGIGKVHDKPKVRGSFGADYELAIKANPCGGIVIESHIPQDMPSKK